MKFALYEPHANQIKIHSSKAKYRVVAAGRRFGKSALALNEALARGFQLKNQIIWIILPLFRQAKEIYWIDPDITRYFMPYIQAGLIKMDKNDLSLHILSTNSWIRLKGSDNYDSLRGAGLDLIIWDEVADTKIEAFEAIAPALADSPRHRALYIGTPKGLNHFHDFALYGNHNGTISTFEKPIAVRKDWETWHFTSLDNMTWAPGSFERNQFVEYIEQQRLEAEEKGKISFFNQEYMASFEESAGRFFPKWTYKTHVLDSEFYPKEGYVRLGSMDWGRTAPFAWYAHAIVPTEYHGQRFNRVITFKEVYDVNKSPFEAAQLICAKIDYKSIKNTYVDPSMGAAMIDGAASIVRQLARSFEEIQKISPTFEKAANKRPARWAIMDNWMRTAPDGLPYWMITRDCINLIRTIPLMVPDPHKLEDLDTTLEDHAVDSCSYALEYIPWKDVGHKPVTPGVARKLPSDPRNISFLNSPKWK
jgi:terminase large subunit-like protein